jgi:hypothetical protein
MRADRPLDGGPNGVPELAALGRTTMNDVAQAKKSVWRPVRMRDESSCAMRLGVTFPKNGGGKGFADFDIDLLESPQKLRLALKRQGAKLHGTIADQVQYVARLIKVMPAGEFISTGKPGFRGEGFIAGPRMLGDAKDKFVWMPDDKNKGIGDRRGTFQDWKELVAVPAASSSFATTSICIAVGACLRSYVRDRIGTIDGLRPLAREGAVFNFSGHSSTGKSFQAAIAASAGGAPEAINDLNFSRRGLEEVAQGHNDHLLILDDTEKHTGIEMKLVSALKCVNQIVPQGKSKDIAKSARDKYPALSWSCLAISSSPIPIDELAAKLEWTRSAGEKLRLIDIPVPPPEKAGIFDRLSGSRREKIKEADNLIKKIAAGMANNYGHLILAWVKYLLEENRAGRVQELTDRFVQKVAPGGLGHETRLAEKFGIVYAAGRMAVDAGLLPWDKSLPWKAVNRCYRCAVAGMSTVEDRAKSQLKSIAAMLDNPERFPKAKSAGAPTVYGSNTIGIRGQLKGRRICAIRDADLTKFAGSAKAAAAIRRLLGEAGALTAGQGHAGTKQIGYRIKVDGKTKKPRFWVFDMDRMLEARSASR